MSDHPRSGTPPATAASHLDQARELVGVIQQLSLARDIDAVARIVRTAARSFTNADGATFVLREGDRCHYVDEDAIEPLWKGQRFPMQLCISGWVMQHGLPAVIEDIYQDERIPTDVYRPTFVKSLFMVPVRTEQPIGAIGNYWARRHVPSPAEAELLQALAGSTALALENVAAFQQLRQQRDRAEQHNAVLGMRIAESKSSEAAMRRDSVTDPLTGLYNRRGFMRLAGKALEIARREDRDCTLVFADVDHLKEINDRYGHAEGDRLIVDTARVLDDAVRDADIVARLGGDEFALFAVGSDRENRLFERIETGLGTRLRDDPHARAISLSIGTLPIPTSRTESLEVLIRAADARMYAAKADHRTPPD